MLAGFELWLDQDDEISAGRSEVDQMTGDRTNGDEGQISDDECPGATQRPGVGVADVGALVDRDARVGPEPLVQLVSANINGDDLRGTALQNTIGETAGRRTGVDHPKAGDVDGEPVEGGIELLTAATHETRTLPGHLDRLAGVDQPRGLRGRRATDRDAA